MALHITDIQNFPNGLAIKWSDTQESFLNFTSLRDQCPCANCKGESDIFGNIYKGPEIKKMDTAYELMNVIKIGHYAIQITWADGHKDGIFTYDFLRKMDLSPSS